MKRQMRRKQEPWNWNKLKGMGTLGALGFFMLFQYQNCAPAMHARSLAGDDSQIVTTIDDVNLTTGVQFLQKQVALPTTDEPTLLEGECDLKQHGAVLGWRVYDPTGDETSRGYAVCEQGHFEVEMAPASELECDQTYDVTAQLNAGASGHVEVKRDCLGEAQDQTKAQAAN